MLARERTRRRLLTCCARALSLLPTQANLFPEGKYLEDGWVEAPKGKAKKGGGEEKAGCVVM